MSPYVQTRTPWRARATASSTSGPSVTHTGQPGPTMSRSAGGITARRPKRAMACSWLPHTCMTATWRPMASTVRRSASVSARARAGSRNFSSRVRSGPGMVMRGLRPGPPGRAHRVPPLPRWVPPRCAPSSRRSRRAACAAASEEGFRPSPARSRRASTPLAVLGSRLLLAGSDLAAHVRRHEIVGPGGAAEHLVEERQRLLHLLGRDSADGEADVVQDVVADLHRLVDDVEPELLADPEEVDRGREAIDRDHLSGNTQAHALAPVTRSPPRSPPSPDPGR